MSAKLIRFPRGVPVVTPIREEGEARERQLDDYIAGRVKFRGQRDLTKAEADEALENLRRSLGRVDAGRDVR